VDWAPGATSSVSAAASELTGKIPASPSVLSDALFEPDSLRAARALMLNIFRVVVASRDYADSAIRNAGYA
jgi:hypothetical protein